LVGLSRRAWPQLTAAAVAVLLVLWARTPELDAPHLPPARVRVKGGESAVELVRLHAGTIAADATRFSAGDRFQVRVSCPLGAAVYWDLLVLQGGEVFFPLTPSAPFHCANGVSLPGAFELDGHQPANVCVLVQSDAPADRAQLALTAARALPGTAACVGLTAD